MTMKTVRKKKGREIEGVQSDSVRRRYVFEESYIVDVCLDPSGNVTHFEFVEVEGDPCTLAVPVEVVEKMIAVVRQVEGE